MLRKVIFRGLGVIFLFMIVIFIGKDFVFSDLIFAPIEGDFILYRWFNALFALVGLAPLSDFSLELINIDLAAQFFIHIKVSFYLAFVVAFPFVIYLVWGFISPALYTNEKSAMKKGFGFAAFLFYLGVAVGYIFVFPLTLRFLGTYQVSESVPNQISLASYIGMFIRLILLMGVVFEMPALAAILSRLGIINRALLKKYRKHAVVVLMVVAAIITPSGDAFTLFMVALPLYMLYEVSILMCKDESCGEVSNSDCSNVVHND